MAERTGQQSVANDLPGSCSTESLRGMIVELARRLESSPPSRLKVIIHPAEEGGYWAEVPGFPGCVSEGETREEVRANIREAFVGVLGAMQDEAAPSPDQTPLDIIEEIEL